MIVQENIYIIYIHIYIYIHYIYIHFILNLGTVTIYAFEFSCLLLPFDSCCKMTKTGNIFKNIFFVLPNRNMRHIY